MNAISHGIGFVISVIGSITLVAAAGTSGDWWRLAGCSVFAIFLMAVYAASTLSHCFDEPHLRQVFRKLDQGFIYLLIVGTYTPFSLTYLPTWRWWAFLGVMWSIGLAGFVSKVFYTHRVETVSVWIYVMLGWMPIIPSGELIHLVPTAALRWMLAGGLCYTLGTVFLISDIKRYHFHGLWHLWVIAGSTCHFLAIWLFVARV